MFTDRWQWVYFFSALLVFLYYGIVCWEFSLERVCHADTAWYLFSVIQGNHDFFLPRPASALTLAPAFAGVWAGMPLKALVHLYSVSFAVVYASIGLLTIRMVNRVSTVFIMSSIVFITTAYTFLNPANESTLALVLVASGLCLFDQFLRTNKNVHFISAVFVWFIAALAHPNSLFTILFCIAFTLTLNKSNSKLTIEKYIALSLPALVAMLLFIYQSRFNSNFQSIEGNLIESLLSLKQNKALDFYLFTSRISLKFFIFSNILWLMGVCSLIITKRLIPLVVYLLSYPILIVISALMYPNGESAIVLEKGFMSIGLISVASVLTVDLEFNNVRRVSVLAALGLLVLVRGNDILFRLKHHSKRYSMMKELVADNHSRKLLVKITSEIGAKYGVYWSSGVESLLYLTAIDENKMSSTILITQGEIINRSEPNQRAFIATSDGAVIDSETLNPEYFNLAEGNYVIVN